jgi:exosortase family protein XrtF
LKNYLIQYKPFLLFLGKFLISYLVLTFIYKSYLNHFNQGIPAVDGFTELVAKQSKLVLEIIDTNVMVRLENDPSQIKFFYNEIFLVRIIEGCNALSIIILFISFIIAFTGKLKQTILYVIGGSLLIHICNIIRIALLIVLMYNFPGLQSLLHDIIFPLIIYGLVFLLWVIWIAKFSLNTKRHASI